MKKTVRLLAVLMIVAMLSVTLVACGHSISGKYSTTFDIGVYEQTTTYEFGMFGKVTRTVVTETLMGEPKTVVTEGKYEIVEDPENPEKLIMVFEFEDEDRATASFVEDTEGDVKYIKLDGMQFNKVD